MNERSNRAEAVVLPPIPAKRYFTIGEVSELCGVKPHVLRYWEQEFTQLKPVKRR
ncbi:MAG: MerR family DNA-binding transcriptional regulator, partial [Burkholderiaceae bacterium]